MLLSCFYDQLDSILANLPTTADSEVTPEKTDESVLKDRSPGNDFLRLEYLSACKIMQDVLTADRYLPHIPHKLYPALFQAIAQKIFNTWKMIGDGPRSATSLSMISLMQHWPYEVMTVRELMPPLPVSFGKHRSLIENREDILSFCHRFLSILPFSFLSRYASSDQSKKPSPLAKLDVSGYHGFVGDTSELKNLEMKIKNGYDPNSPPNYEKCELVIDASCLQLDEEMWKTLEVICSISLLHGAGLVVKFRRVHILSTVSKAVIPFIEILAKNNATEYLELETCELSDDVMKRIVSLSHSLTGLSLAYASGFSSIQFLTLLPNLCQLDLSGVNLQGKMRPLTRLHQGLKYLKLVGCSLKLKDIDIFSSSHHTKSLLELDLGDNSFDNPASATSLCSLCMELTKLLILELDNCCLHKISAENVGDCVDILRNMPELRILRLTDNDFSSRVIRNQLPHLASSKSLQYICLTVPGDAYMSDDYNVVENEIRKLKSDFTKQIEIISRKEQSSLKPQLYVEWNEEVTYSHWYYSV